jgi:hypothetical protein
MVLIAEIINTRYTIKLFAWHSKWSNSFCQVKINIKTNWFWPLLKNRITSFWMSPAQIISIWLGWEESIFSSYLWIPVLVEFLKNQIWDLTDLKLFEESDGNQWLIKRNLRESNIESWLINPHLISAMYNFRGTENNILKSLIILFECEM